jgi:hypothetical protein
MEDDMKRKKVFPCMFCIYFAILILMAGCGKDDSQTITTPEGKVTVTTKNDTGKETVKIETKEGSLTVKTGSHTISEAEFGVPVYPGAQVVSSGQIDETKNNAPGVSATYLMTTNDNYDKVVAFYKANLKKVEQSMNHTMGDEKIAMFTIGKEGDMKNIQIFAKTSGGPTNINITKITTK